MQYRLSPSCCFTANANASASQSVRLHAELSLTVVKARLGHLIGLLSLSQYTSTKHQGTIDLLSDSVTEGDNMPHLAGRYLTFLWKA